MENSSIRSTNVTLRYNRNATMDVPARMRCVFYFLLPCVLSWAWTANGNSAQTATDLQHVRRVFVGSLGEKPGASALRKRIIDELKRSHEITPASSASDADAVLTGDGETYIRGYISLNPRSGTRAGEGEPIYDGFLSVELKGKNDEVLWSYLATPRFQSSHVEQDLAKQVCRKIEQALGIKARP